ncbi:sporulation protein YqfD [Virgibacillus phasianinus]|uniref:Sporulation protein YqfD n=1 Tax=Virgibacillus phasianinus TaxID=2017483 RepID=A0A220U518_9BACI|nr:sporulation protein YqfD [Virgibacillus phasianinus]ASK63155.1 sporulation protein YqfD [Virgibacillus phasianinus]
MKQIQGSFLTGYVTILVEGNNPELFLQYCADQEILVWNITKVSSTSCEASIRLGDVHQVDELIHEGLTITVTHQYGLPVMIKKLIGRKEFLFSIGICLLLILYLSNIIWDIKINGVPKDIEKKITKQLNTYGVHTGALGFSIGSPSEIQQKLLHDIPELLWVGVEKKGTTFQIEVVEKTIVEKKEINGPSNLVAAKEGVVSYVYISKGMPNVKVNDYVEAGDLLVSGNISEDKEKPVLVEADGEVVAKTWYEVSVTIPLKAEYQELTGEKEKKLYMELGDVQVPFWGFGSSEFEHVQTDINRTPLHFFKWELPINIIESIQHEKTYRKEQRSKKEAIKVGKEQAKNELLLRLDKNAKVISEKVLHESTGNGKVKLILYLTIEENIAKSVPINQGD